MEHTYQLNLYLLQITLLFSTVGNTFGILNFRTNVIFTFGRKTNVPIYQPTCTGLPIDFCLCWAAEFISLPKILTGFQFCRRHRDKLF